MSRVLDYTVRAAARILTGSTYAYLGYEAARSPGPRVAMAAPTLAAIRKVLPFLPANDDLIVRANGAFQSVAGVLMTVGKLQTPTAYALFGSLVPTTVAGHAFWSVDDPNARKAQRVQFQKNMAMLGGALFAARDGSR